MHQAKQQKLSERKVLRFLQFSMYHKIFPEECSVKQWISLTLGTFYIHADKAKTAKVFHTLG